jgi:hypothetical protein
MSCHFTSGLAVSALFKNCVPLSGLSMIKLSIVLDPRIGYHGLLAEAATDANEARSGAYNE